MLLLLSCGSCIIMTDTNDDILYPYILTMLIDHQLSWYNYNPSQTQLFNHANLKKEFRLAPEKVVRVLWGCSRRRVMYIQTTGRRKVMYTNIVSCGIYSLMYTHRSTAQSAVTGDNISWHRSSVRWISDPRPRRRRRRRGRGLERYIVHLHRHRQACNVTSQTPSFVWRVTSWRRLFITQLCLSRYPVDVSVDCYVPTRSDTIIPQLHDLVTEILGLHNFITGVYTSTSPTRPGLEEFMSGLDDFQIFTRNI